MPWIDIYSGQTFDSPPRTPVHHNSSDSFDSPRKITFPFEVTIFVAESSYSSRLHGRGEQSPKMTRVLEHYRSFLVQGALRRSPDWTSSFPQRGLIVEPPGFSDIENDSGGDFVSEDIRQWLSSMSSPCSSGQFSLTDSMLDSDSFYSPRKSYTDVLKSSGSSLSVTISLDSDPRFESYKRWILFILFNNFCDRTVHWPHSSFRYMFLGERMKTFIHEIVQVIRSRYGESVVVTCPYRDKKDASVCILLEGPQVAVDDSILLFNHMLSEVLEQLRCMTLILSGTQFTCLTAQDLVKVKAVQGSAGVHVMSDTRFSPASSESN
jgi:hypothetical protein